MAAIRAGQDFSGRQSSGLRKKYGEVLEDSLQPVAVEAVARKPVARVEAVVPVELAVLVVMAPRVLNVEGRAHAARAFPLLRVLVGVAQLRGHPLQLRVLLGEGGGVPVAQRSDAPTDGFERTVWGSEARVIECRHDDEDV